MKKGVNLSLIFLVTLGLIFSVGVFSAESGSGSDGSDASSTDSVSGSSNSGSSSDEKQEETKETTTVTDEEGRQVEVETKTKTKNGETEVKEKRTFLDENGNKVVIETKTETKDGKTESIVKRKIETPEGIEVTYKTKTEIRDGKEKITSSIEVEGAEVNTELSVKQEIKNNKTILKAELSTGVEQEIIVLPDEALEIALNEIKSANNFTFEIKEIADGETRKAVFQAKALKSGRLLGIFNTEVDLEALIDTETGKIIKTNRPWWAFLVVGGDKADVCHVASEGNETKVVNINIAIPAVKAHLAHGDTLGKCTAECGDLILVESVEMCDDGNLVNGDGCSSICEIEQTTPTTNSSVSGTLAN